MTEKEKLEIALYIFNVLTTYGHSYFNNLDDILADLRQDILYELRKVE